MGREQVRMWLDWIKMEGNQGGKSKENGLVIRFVGYWERWAISLVECEIEVLYQILAWGILKKMKIYPMSSNARKSIKIWLYSGCLWRSGRPALASFAALWLWAVCAVACLALAGFALACAVLCIT